MPLLNLEGISVEVSDLDNNEFKNQNTKIEQQTE
jgi:hypothetical protein